MPILKMNCVVCGKEYIGGIFPSRTTKFCSRKCCHSSFVIPRSNKICVTCKKSFFILESQKKGKFCSTRCIRYSADRQKLRTKKGKGFWQTATEDEKIQRLRSNYEKIVIKKDGCWGWKRKLLANGYATINTGRDKALLAHRVSWILHAGQIPDKMLVLHKCDNPPCTNPDHLFLGNHLDNMRDMISKGRKVNRSDKRRQLCT